MFEPPRISHRDEASLGYRSLLQYNRVKQVLWRGGISRVLFTDILKCISTSGKAPSISYRSEASPTWSAPYYGTGEIWWGTVGSAT